VPDLKPPRLNSGDRHTLLALLQYQRDSLIRKVTGADEDAARQPVVGSGTTLIWLAKHMAAAETLWIACRFAGQEAAVPEQSVQPADTVRAVLSGYRAASAQADAIIATAGLDEPCRGPGGELIDGSTGR
jgi:uncharacterized damage-inducible protein DinB